MHDLVPPESIEHAIQIAKDLNTLTGGSVTNVIRFLGTQGADAITKARSSKLFKRAKEKADELGGFSEEGPDVSLLEPALQGALYEGRAELSDYWSTLIAKIMNGRENSIRFSYLETLKKFDPEDALLLDLYNNPIYRDAIKVQSGELTSVQPRNRSLGQELAKFHSVGLTEDDVVISREHLEALGCVKYSIYAPATATPYGRSLYRAVTMPNKPAEE